VSEQLVEPVSEYWAEWIDYPFKLRRKLWLWLLRTFLIKLVYRHEWYSKRILRFCNGDNWPCDFTAVDLFAERIGQPGRMISEHSRKIEPVRPDVVSWTSLTGNRPLLLTVRWSPKNPWKVHVLCYESGFLTHSCSLDGKATRNGIDLGFPVRRDPVTRPELFELVATQSGLGVDGRLHYQIIKDVLGCMRNMPGIEQVLDFDRLERKMYIACLQRTRLPVDGVVSLSLQDRLH
jgi:hypothetical protein